MGQELERHCEFASALKYYYTGKVYYAKLDELGSKPYELDSASVKDSFERHLPQLYHAMFQALQAVAASENHKEWAKKHTGVLLGSWASDEQKENHMKDCLNFGVSDGSPGLKTVCYAE